MEKWKRMVLPAAALLLAFALGAGVGMALPESGREEPAVYGEAAAGEKTRIVYYDTHHNAGAGDAVIEEFNRRSGTTEVAVTYINNDDYDLAIEAMLASGSAEADCLFIRQPAQANKYAKEGRLLDITAYVGGSGLHVANYGATMDIVRQQERLYALPRVRSAWLLFYNQDLFDQAGLPYPGQLTWEEYAALAGRLAQGAGEERVWGGYIPDWTMNLGASSAGEYLTDDELPLTMEYVTLLHRLYNEDKSHPGLALMQQSGPDCYELFGAGRVAMMINGDWTILRFQSDFQETGLEPRWDVAPLPVLEPGFSGATVGGCSYAGIPAASRNPGHAFEFLAFLCGEQGGSILADYASCPAYFTQEAAEVYIRQAGKPNVRVFFESAIANEEGAHPLYREINLAFKAEMQSYLLGETDLEQAFAGYYAQRAGLLSGS